MPFFTSFWKILSHHLTDRLKSTLKARNWAKNTRDFLEGSDQVLEMITVQLVGQVLVASFQSYILLGIVYQHYSDLPIGRQSPTDLINMDLAVIYAVHGDLVSLLFGLGSHVISIGWYASERHCHSLLTNTQARSKHVIDDCWFLGIRFGCFSKTHSKALRTWRTGINSINPEIPPKILGMELAQV